MTARLDVDKPEIAGKAMAITHGRSRPLNNRNIHYVSFEASPVVDAAIVARFMLIAAACAVLTRNRSSQTSIRSLGDFKPRRHVDDVEARCTTVKQIGGVALGERSSTDVVTFCVEV